ncbi:MAG TPA: zinc ribbon domain-containing protein [Gemmatimonadaceae bacterium]|jgi:hypothetical protein
MDDLDRLFRRLVQNIRNGYPEYLTHPFEVSELYQNLIPYRHNRREMAIETNEDYEIALCRLLSGERGYLAVDDALAAAIRAELATPNPNTTIFREFAASRIAMTAAAQRRGNELAGEATPVAGTTPVNPTVVPSPASAHQSWRPHASSSGMAATAEADVVATAHAMTAAGEGSCRYCGGALPEGRRIAFCPHCGQNLTIQRCPACGTELEISWKFCITCGRGIAAS